MLAFISPAMGFTTQKSPLPETRPCFYDKTHELVDILQTYSPEKIAELMGCSADIALKTYEYYQRFNEAPRTAAALAFQGIAYKVLDAQNLNVSELDYLSSHLAILSGLWGYLRAQDGICPYRLEMKCKLSGPGFANLYKFWGDKLYQQMSQDAQGIIVNLASAEYSKCIEPYLQDELYITCDFKVEKNGKLKTLSTAAKQARGHYVRWMAQNAIGDIYQLVSFDEDGYRFCEELSNNKSTKQTLVFIKQQ